MTHQIVYSSASSEKMPKSKLYQILRQARLGNAKRGVTGILVFADNTFFQVLEGQEDVVRSLMQKITPDKRHRDVKIIFEGQVAAPAFSSWEMAYVSTNAQEMAAWAGLRSTTTLDDTLDHLRSTPSHVPDILLKLIGAISEP